MKFTLIRNGEDKVLKKGQKILGTWDKHDTYEYVVECAQARMGEDDELIEKTEDEKAVKVEEQADGGTAA
jgi:hypothetical protein